MVNQTTNNNRAIYTCPVCGLNYANEKIAQQCEAWCRAHSSCNLKIIKNALPPDQKNTKQTL